MNIQTVKNATKVVAKKTRQPKTAVRVGAITMGVLTFISQMSYESGSFISTLIPYEHKAWVTAAAGLATLILGYLGEYMPNRPVNPPTEPPAP